MTEEHKQQIEDNCDNHIVMVQISSGAIDKMRDIHKRNSYKSGAQLGYWLAESHYQQLLKAERGKVRRLREGVGEKEQSKMWDEIEEIFDKHTSPTGGGYEADYTDRTSFFNEVQSKFIIQKRQLLTDIPE